MRPVLVAFDTARSASPTTREALSPAWTGDFGAHKMSTTMSATYQSDQIRRCEENRLEDTYTTIQNSRQDILSTTLTMRMLIVATHSAAIHIDKDLQGL